MEVSHLLFVDDTLIFCETWEEQMTFLCWVLMWFEAISGLKVNLDKSELIPMGRVENVDDLAGEMGCKVGRFSSTYLGMPLEASFNFVAAWDGIEGHKRLAMWKQQYISKGGRITLIRNSLSSLPIYFMSILHLPRVVRMRLERIQKDFLWGGGVLEQIPHLVKRSSVCLDKNKRGWELRALLCSTSLSLANDCGGLQTKERLFGTKL